MPFIHQNQCQAGYKSNRLECDLLLLKGTVPVDVPLESRLSAIERLTLFQAQTDQPRPVWHGSESHIYLSQKYPDLGMKVSRPKAILNFNSSAERLTYLKYFIQSSEEIAKFVHVVEIYERGPGWLIKKVVSVSRPLQEAILIDQEAKETLHNLRRAVFNIKYRNSENPLVRDFVRRLNMYPLSTNIHWDPIEKKILVIDAL